MKALSPLGFLAGELLHVANGAPGSEAFYALKEALCRRYGEAEGEEWQHIRRECWNCDRTGNSEVGRCSRCWGTGIYSESWHRLERWRIGSRGFHRPAERRFSAPGVPIAIEGRIRKEGDVRDAAEATLWLYLLFARGELRRRLRARSYYCTPGLRPLLGLQWLLANLQNLWHAFDRRECITCRQPFRRPSLRTLHFQCRPCAERPRAALWDELPF